MSELNYLSDIEKAKIIQFNEDIVMHNAVKKVLLEAIYNNGVLRKDISSNPLRNAALALASAAVNGSAGISDSMLGQDLRGMMSGISLLEQGLIQLAKIKRDNAPEVSGTLNEAI